MTHDVDPVVERIRSAQFREARQGYDVTVVDDLLDRAVLVAARGEPLRPLLEAAVLPTARRGYRTSDVDALLAELGATRPAIVDPVNPIESRRRWRFRR